MPSEYCDCAPPLLTPGLRCPGCGKVIAARMAFPPGSKLRVPVTTRQIATVLSLLESFEANELGDGECHYLIAQVSNKTGEVKWRWKVAISQKSGPLPSAGVEGFDGE